MILIKLLFVSYLILFNRSLAEEFWYNTGPNKGGIYIPGEKWGHHYEGEISKMKDEDVMIVRHDIIPYIPRSFDARKNWPMCKSISRIKDQRDCSVSWAFAAAAVTTDRSCIASGGKKTFNVSEHDLIQCCKTCDVRKYDKINLCDIRSHFKSGFEYMIHTGVATEECKQYNTKTLHLECEKSCDSKQVPYKRFKYYKISIGSVKTSQSMVRDMQVEIMTNGPIAGVLHLIPHDFDHNYTNEVYTLCETCKRPTPKEHYASHPAQQIGHAIKILGWGVKRKVPFWLCANSWGKKWGKLGGFFKIERGKNELSIEQVFAAPYPHDPDDRIFAPVAAISRSSRVKTTHQLYKITVIVLIILTL